MATKNGTPVTNPTNSTQQIPTEQPSTSTRNASAPPRPSTEDPDLIDVMNDLQNKMVASGLSLDVCLPQIMVVGSQSAGKSSVLENIVGREFLPRGAGVVTKRPILIQLFPIPSGEDYATFGNKPDPKFTDFSKVRQEIEAQMPSKADGKSTFSSVPITLQIYSTRVLKLTLVDLPGVVRNVLDGQSESNIRELREMVLGYISQPEGLILAVTPANQDLALSDALEIAKIADPERARTIGVLTKIDIMDIGTDAHEILENRQIQLKRGYVGVLNRSQQDIDDGKDIQYILDKEKDYFSSKPCYSHLVHKMGTPYLRKMLQKTLRAHIKAALPDVRGKLAEKLTGIDRTLKQMEMKMGGGSKGKRQYMHKLVNSFIQDIDMEVTGNSELVDMSKISAGAYIHYKLNTEVMRYLKLSLVPKEEDLTILLTNMHGYKGGSLSFQPRAVDAMCRKLLTEFDYPLEKSVECIRKVFDDAINESACKMDEYPTMKSEILYRINCRMEEETVRTQEKLKEHVLAEMGYVNLGHPDLDLTVCDALVPSVGPTNIWSGADEEPESSVDAENAAAYKTRHIVKVLMQNESLQKKVQYMMLVLTKYMEIVQKQIMDLTVKYIITFLITRVLNFIKFDMVPSLLESANLASLEEDCDEAFRQKEEMENTRTTLRDALDAIQKF